MDWTKAKTILIIALLATNLFLLGSHAMRHGGVGDEENGAALLQILASRNIMLEVEVPKNHKPMPILQGEYVDASDEEVEALIEGSRKNEPCESRDDYIKAAEDFITYLGMMDESVALTDVTEEKGKTQVLFESRIGPVEVAGNYMQCTFENGRISGFKYRWLKAAGMSQRKANIISAAAALLTLENTEGKEIRITGINLVYHVPENSDVDYGSAVSDTAFPTWEICTGDGERIYVEAV